MPSRVSGPATLASGRPALLFLAVLLGLIGLDQYYNLFGRFSSWDDEGYLMLSIYKYVSQGQVLYDEIYTQYGPFFFLFHRLLNGILGVPVTHDAVRWVFLGFTLVLVAACFRLVFFLTRSHLASFLAAVPFGWMLRQLAAEPAHPQGLVLILIAFILIAPSLVSWPGPRGRLLFVAMGAGAAALALVKPNIGVYQLLGLLWAMLSMTSQNWWMQAARYLLAVASLVLPAVLMAAHLRESWALKYTLLTTITLAPALTLLVRKPLGAGITLREWAVFLGSSLVAGLAILAAVMLGGTTPAKFVGMMFLENMQFASKFVVPLEVPRETFGWAAVSVVLFVVRAVSGRVSMDLSALPRVLGLSTSGTVRVPVDVLLLGGFGCFATVVAYRGLAAGTLSLWEGAALFLWIGLLPARLPSDDVPARRFGRVLLVMTAAFQLLHAYPVAGSQVSWALLWMPPVAVVCLHDALGLLTRAASQITWRRGVETARSIVTVTVLVLVVALTLRGVRLVRGTYVSGEPIGLPGAMRVRTNWIAAETYRWLAFNLRTADTFVSAPGLDSLYLWTGKTPPGILGGGFWMRMLNDEQQRAIIDAVSPLSNVKAVRSTEGLNFWARGQDFSGRPLMAYINRNFRTVARAGEYEFMVRRDSPSAAPQANPLLSSPLLRLPAVAMRRKPKAALLDGTDALLSSSDNEVQFNWPTGVRSMAWSYRFHPDNCRKDARRPVQVSVRTEPLAAGGVLIERTLSPQAGDEASELFFEVAVRASGVRLMIETRALSGPPVEDCLYWRDITIR